MEGTELLTSVLSALLDPVEGPEFELLTWEGAGAKVLELPPLEREIVRGHNWVLDTNGRLLEHGSLVRESSENPWAYRLQRPDEYATQTIISLVAVVGPHHVNA